LAFADNGVAWFCTFVDPTGGCVREDGGLLGVSLDRAFAIAVLAMKLVRFEAHTERDFAGLARPRNASWLSEILMHYGKCRSHDGIALALQA
jgi:hypothetical protein